jgi:hypothetical protein
MTLTPTSGNRNTCLNARHLKFAACTLALLMPAAITLAAEPAVDVVGGAPLSEHQRQVLENAGTGIDNAQPSAPASGVESGVNDGGAPLTPHQREALKAVDTDGDGQLNSAEYSKYQSHSGTTSGFGQTDRNRDGYVSSEELSALQAAIARDKARTRIR